jgi:hypothetical protein
MPMMTYGEARRLNRLREGASRAASASKTAVLERKEALALTGTAALTSYGIGYYRGMQGDEASKILGVDMEWIVGGAALLVALGAPAMGKKLGGWWGQAAIEGIANGALGVATFKQGLLMGEQSKKG